MSESELRAIPNVGPAIARMLMRIGIETASQLRGADADDLYARLCEVDGQRYDPCVLDTFTAAVDFSNGAPARPWWRYSRRRKATAQAGSFGVRCVGAPLSIPQIALEENRGYPKRRSHTPRSKEKEMNSWPRN
jgi:hypothetical protein